MSDTFTTVPIVLRDIRVDDRLLEAIQEAASRGLKAHTIAWAVGITPEEFSSAYSRDVRVEHAILRGRAEGEMAMANTLYTAAIGGDSKSALAILQHRYGWQTKSEEVDTALKESQLTRQDLKNLSIEELEQMRKLALKAEGKPVIEGVATPVKDASSQQ